MSQITAIGIEAQLYSLIDKVQGEVSAFNEAVQEILPELVEDGSLDLEGVEKIRFAFESIEQTIVDSITIARMYEDDLAAENKSVDGNWLPFDRADTETMPF